MAKEVMVAEVEEERMTWRKGCSREGVSNVRISNKESEGKKIWPKFEDSYLSIL